MNWVSFLEGGISFMLAFALFSYDPDEVTEEELEEETEEEPEEKTREKKRFYQMFCGTCRKQQKHVKLREEVYQCNKCKRTTDMRDI